ncbi:endolytic transglycosylase MltG [Solicola sp. PLA-1-18]|uniref:endolytic transglycosylase MltG n=1 Tax=Solicola sp. PLA-1-18 TaxID=3380532 RepID=UPI003B807417
MSGIGLDLNDEGDGRRGGGGRRAAPRKRKPWGCAFVVVVVAALLVGAYVGVSKGAGAVSGWINGPEDYSGQGTGEVQVEVKQGDTAAAIGRTLKSKGVVASVDAFIELANTDERAQAIQPGTYQLREKMSSKWALDELSDTANLLQTSVAIPEGFRVGQIVERIAANTDITEEALTAALDDPDSIGLPAVARDNPEGYLFPATYEVKPDTTATELLSQMVAKTVEVEQSLDIDARAKALGITTEQALTVASIIEYEAKRDEDLPKVARVIYNRLDEGQALQMDSTITYVSQRKGDVWTTEAERNVDSKYNTYRNTGLPPGPIGSPGERTIEAALNPAEGDWLYFMPQNLETGDTVFTASYAEHLKNVEKFRAYCRKSDLC